MSHIFNLLIGISRVYTYSTYGFIRLIIRDGGTNSGGGWFIDGVATVCSPTVDMANCTGFCIKRAAYQCWDSWDPTNSITYYIKCFDGQSDQPLNHLRAVFMSQIGTIDIDPAIPPTPLGNYSFCHSIKNFNRILNSLFSMFFITIEYTRRGMKVLSSTLK